MVDWSRESLERLADLASTPPLDDSKTVRAKNELVVRQILAQIKAAEAARWSVWLVAAGIVTSLLISVIS